MSGGKQAVAFVLDASPSMNSPYPSKSKSSSSTGGTTRFSCARSAVGDMISDLMLQSKMNEVIVVVVNAPGGAGATRHHLCCDEQVEAGTAPFPGIVSLNGMEGTAADDGGDGDGDGDGEYRGMAKPNVSLLRQLRRLEIDATDERDDGDEEGGDGLVDSSSGSETDGDDDDHDDDGESPPPRKRPRGGGRRTRRLADFCDGIVVAADAVHRRTAGKKFVRRLVLFTDAANEIAVHPGHVQTVVDGLVRLGCTLDVIGLDFDDDASAVFEVPASQLEAKPDVNKAGPTDAAAGSGDGESEREEDDDAAEGGSHGSDGDATADNSGNGGDGSSEEGEEEDEDDDEEPDPGQIKSENEKFLISLARLTGGSVTAASTLRQVLRKARGRRTPRSTRSKMVLDVAPDLSVRARFSLLVSRANMPTPKREVVLVDERGEPLRDGLGEERTSAVRNPTTHWDADDDDLEVAVHERTDAYRYGSDLIPIGGFDIEGLRMRSPVRMAVLGYAPRGDVPRSLFVGTPYAVTGEDDSARSCAVLSALARPLHDLDQVAVCSFVKSKDRDPVVGALFPLVFPERSRKREGEDGTDQASSAPKTEQKEKPAPSTPPCSLFFVQMPFANDVSRITMRPLDDDRGADAESSRRRRNVADDLVDSLTLPDDSLRSELVPNPSLRCLYRTLVRRAVQRDGSIDAAGGVGCGVVEVRRPCGRRVSTGDSVADAVGEDGEEGGEDPMSTPGWVVERSRDCIEHFKETFPVVKERQQDGRGGKRKKKRKYWSDIV